MKFLSKLLCILPLGVLMSCGNSDTAGNTTEIENAIAVRVYNNGKPAARVSYQVLPSWFMADTASGVSESDFIYTGETDNDGWMHIDNHHEGAFTVQFFKDSNTIVSNYTINKLTPVVTIDSVALAKPGSIRGWVTLPKKAKYAWVYLQGISRVEKTDSTGAFVIDNLPRGELKLKAWVPEAEAIIAETQVTIPSKDTLDLGHVEAPDEVVITKSMKINPRTLISSWMRPLEAPYVLVLRLDSTFNFDETDDEGKDIRILNGNGDLLPIEVDSWDKGIRSGAINIRVEDLKDTAKLWTIEWGDIYAPMNKPDDIWEDLSDSLVRLLNTVKILDFEDTTYGKNNLPAPLYQKDFYIGNSIGAQILDSSNIDIKYGYVKSDGGGFGKKVFHLKYEASSEESQYIVIGTRISQEPHDLSRLDSVELWAKGDGKIQVILETYMDESDTNYKATYETSISDKWERIVVRPQDFNTKDLKSYHGWDVTRNRITRFTIFAYDGKEVWVDNVRLYGINRDDLMQQQW